MKNNELEKEYEIVAAEDGYSIRNKLTHEAANEDEIDEFFDMLSFEEDICAAIERALGPDLVASSIGLSDEVEESIDDKDDEENIEWLWLL